MKPILRFFALLCLVLAWPVHAQTVRITGTVTDAKTREGVPSAVVKVGTSRAVTDLDGKFIIQGAQLPATLLVEASDDSLTKWWKGKFTLEEFHERLKAVTDLKIATLQDAGHMLHHDQAEALAQLLEDFLA